MSPANLPLWARNNAIDIRASLTTIDSWDTCMAEDYCKWPVIVAIIVVAVIVVSVLGCVINCLCCGYQCCAACCGCFSCCCPSGRRRQRAPKYYDEAPIHHPPPPVANPTYQASPAPPVYRGAVQTATFDNSSKGATSKVDDDSLPAMPTWAGASDKRVEDKSHRSDDVEMEPLKPQGQMPDRRQGAGTPMHSGTAYPDYPPDRGTPMAGYRGFNPTDPYARRSPGPGAAFAAAQDPYGRRSPGLTTSPVDPYGRRSPGPAFAGAQDPYGRRSPGPPGALGSQDPYGRRSPGPAAAFAGTQDPYGRRSPGPPGALGSQDPYGRRSPGPAAAFAGAQDPYGGRSPGLTSPVGAPVPYDHQPYHQPYDDYGNNNNNNNNNNYHAVSSPSPVAAYKPPTTYSPVPMSFTPSTVAGHSQTPGFQRQPSFGSSQYPPTYTSQPRNLVGSPSLPSSPPPPFQAPQPQPQYTAYNGQQHGPQEQSIAIGTAVTESDRNRPPSLLQSGRQPAPNSFRDV